MRGRHRGGGRGRRLGRPFKEKLVSEVPSITFFKPAGIRLADLEIEMLSVEELEALKLVDMQDLDQEEAAKKMGISRKTLWRLLHDAREKVVTALANGKAIEVKGGSYTLREKGGR